MPLALALIIGTTAAGATGFLAGVDYATDQTKERVRYWLTVGAAAATIYWAWRTLR